MVKYIPVVHFVDLPGGEYFLSEHAHAFKFSFGDAEFTLVSPREVLESVEQGIKDIEDMSEAEILSSLGMALRELPEGVLVAFIG